MQHKSLPLEDMVEWRWDGWMVGWLDGRSLGEWPPGASQQGHLYPAYRRYNRHCFSGWLGTGSCTSTVVDQRTNEAGNAHRSGAIRLSNNRPANDLVAPIEPGPSLVNETSYL